MSKTHINTVLAAVFTVACITVFFTGIIVSADTEGYIHPETGESITRAEMVIYLREQASEIQERIDSMTEAADEEQSREETITLLHEEIERASERITALSKRQAKYAAERERKIEDLQEEIETVRGEIAEELFVQDTPISVLSVGDSGPRVTALQAFLNWSGFSVAMSGPGSAGNETSYFGPLTARALSAFQEAHGIEATGSLDRPTRELVLRMQGGITRVSLLPGSPEFYRHPETGKPVTKKVMIQHLTSEIKNAEDRVVALRVQRESDYAVGGAISDRDAYLRRSLDDIRAEIEEVRRMIAVLLEKRELESRAESEQVSAPAEVVTTPEEEDDSEVRHGEVTVETETDGTDVSSSGILVTVLVIILLIILFAVPAVMYWKNRDEMRQ